MGRAAFAWPADVAPKERLGTATGLYRVIGDVSLVLGPITVTYIADAAGGNTVFVLPVIVPAVLALLVVVGLRWAPDPAVRRGT
ncbi:MAG: MFS transporter [Candidatus Bipolaricaulaceae bacterium]